ncbi:MAG: T9SS type A sorting domain-containing protein [Bacteroidia bacterium]
MKQKIYLPSFLILVFTLLSNLSFSQNVLYYGGRLWYEPINTCTQRVYVEIIFACDNVNNANLPAPNVSIYNPSIPLTPPPPDLASANPTNPTYPILSYTTEPANCATLTLPATLTPLYYYEVPLFNVTMGSNCGSNTTGWNRYMAATYYFDVNICGLTCQKINFELSKCCIPNLLANVGSPMNIFYTNTLSIDMNYPTNHSANIVNEIPMYICTGMPNYAYLAGYDVDGDSLSYSLDSIFDQNGSSIHGFVGTNPTTPLGTNGSFVLNPATGEMIISAINTSNTMYMVNIGVTEWRNGIAINKTQVSNSFYVTSCGASYPYPDINSPTNIQNGQWLGNNIFEIKPNANFSFEVQTTHTNTNQTMEMGCDFMPATTSTIGTNPMLTTLNWTPSLADSGIHYVRLKATDNNSTFRRTTVKLYKLRVLSYTIEGNVTNTTCGANMGGIDITPIGLIAPIHYSWSTSDTTEDIQNVGAGMYYVNVMDNVGHSLQDTFYVNNSNMQGNLTVSPANCNGTGGLIQPVITGGIMPYQYSWSNGSVMPILANTSANTVYSVDITDVSGCYLHLVALQTQFSSCYNYISGYVFDDTNQNCVKDAGEMGMPNKLVMLASGAGVLSDANGYYVIATQYLGNDTLSIYTGNPNHIINCPTGYTYPMNFSQISGQVLANQNFPIYTLAHKDIAIYLPSSPYLINPNPAITNVNGTTILYKNLGNTTQNVMITYNYPNVVDSIHYTAPAYNSYDPITKICTWNINNVAPYSTGNIYIDEAINTSGIIPSAYPSNANISPYTNDINLSNNEANNTRTIMIGTSYDPNNKLVVPQGVGAAGNISPDDSLLTYTINFQNTGTAPAMYVVLRDTLDNDVKVNSFEFIGSSHACSITIENGNILVFKFLNINLPDSTTDEPNSHGFVMYQIKTKENLALGTEIRNAVSIYFDANEPVKTNETLNTIFWEDVAISATYLQNVSIYPNPTDENSLLSFENKAKESYEILIYDVIGNLVRKLVTNQESVLLGKGELTDGLYFVEVKGRKMYQGKWVVR